MKQRTILKQTSVTGKALHSGEEVRLVFKPAPANSGILFRRTDLHERPEIKPGIQLVKDHLVRGTDLTLGHTKIHTVEHVLSALYGLGIDNAQVEMNASEPPILDGSAAPYVEALLEARPAEQEAEREHLVLKQPVNTADDSRFLFAIPYDGLKITCTSADDRGVHTQHLSLDIGPETYQSQIAQARTFTVYEEIEELLQLGKIKGGSLDSAIVIKGDKIMSKNALRFKDEFVRHKILDLIGDLVLLGRPLKAHIIAVKPGHRLNAELVRKISEQLNSRHPPQKNTSAPLSAAKQMCEMDVPRIHEILPHRYPFLLIDRVTSIPNEKEIRAIKNVTINEPYFKGHFPGMWVMPGVLQIEAMAQAAGLLMLRLVSKEGQVAYFMSCDKVKFRQAVLPGDQLRIHVILTQLRGQTKKIATAKGTCEVDGKIVSEAELMFTIAEGWK